jgi:hypothetical protein
MTEQGPKFNKEELGNLTIRFISICSTCSRKDNCPELDCPVKLARSYIVRYLQKDEQVLKDVDVSILRSKPEGAVIDKIKMNELLNIIHQLCNKCMFHVEKCFINLVYTLIETMLEKNPKKQLSKRPSDIN